MADPALGELVEVDLRRVWSTEAQDFTPWLAQNLELLGGPLGLELSLVQQEAKVGPFSLDILATDQDGNMVAIENQLEATDHTHLGQLLTYAAGHDARTLIWITPNFQNEHRAALDWLNTWTPADVKVYGVEVRVVRIGDSLPAPEFIPVVLPNEWRNREQAKLNPDAARRREFYQPLVDSLRAEGFTDRQNATSAYIQRFPSGVEGLTYNADIGNNPRVFISMSDSELKERIFGTLCEDAEQMEKIESALQLSADPESELNWKTAPGNISVSRKGSGDNLTDETRDWMFNYLIEFQKAFDGPIEEIIRERGLSADLSS